MPETQFTPYVDMPVRLRPVAVPRRASAAVVNRGPKPPPAESRLPGFHRRYPRAGWGPDPDLASQVGI